MRLVERALTLTERLQLVLRIFGNLVKDLRGVHSHKAVEFIEDEQEAEECCAKPVLCTGKINSMNCRKKH